jgi:hypothetical protein
LGFFGYRPEYIYYTQKDVEKEYAKYLGKDWIKEDVKV